jgi:antitoxin component YwqK of YwqJK toxin-antitoxin module
MVKSEKMFFVPAYCGSPGRLRRAVSLSSVLVFTLCLSRATEAADRSTSIEAAVYRRGSLKVKYIKGTEVFFNDGSLRCARLARDQTFEGKQYTAATELHFYPDGHVAFDGPAFGEQARTIRSLAAEYYPDGTPSMLKLSEDQVIDGIKYQGITMMWFHPNGRVRQGYVVGKPMIQGLPCEEDGTVQFFPSGGLEAIRLGRDFVVSGAALPKGTWTHLLSSGVLDYAELPDNSVLRLVEGIQFGGPTGSFASVVQMYPNGHVYFGELLREQTVQGNLLLAYTQIYFFPSGKIQTVSNYERALTIFGVQYAAKTSVSFFESGKVLGGTLSIAQKVEGVDYAAGSEIVFHPTGAVSKGKLAQDRTSQGIEFMHDSSIEFYEDGNPRLGLLARPQKIQGLELDNSAPIHVFIQGDPPYDEMEVHGIELYANGKVKSAFLSHAQVIQGFLLGIAPGQQRPASDALATFYDDGTLQKGMLTEETLVQGLLLARGTWLTLHPNGKLQVGTLAAAAGAFCRAGRQVKLDENGRLLKCVRP